MKTKTRPAHHEPRLRILRHTLDGVWYGMSEKVGDDWIVRDAKRLRRWEGPSDLSGVAAGTNLKSGTYFTPPVEEVVLSVENMCGVYAVSEKGKASLDAVEVRDLPK